ncbi:MAG: helix-turn-helix domain-containing protein [Flavobacterium sp.]
MKNKENTRHIVIMVPRTSTILSIAGPLEIFTTAIEETAETNLSGIHYVTHVVSTQNEEHLNTSSSLSIITEGSYKNIDYPIDTLIISGISDPHNYHPDTDLLEWINLQAKLVRRVCSVCTGAFLLAKAGILNGKKATTHWLYCRQLASEYPEVHMEIAPFYVKDKNIYTSAGLSSGMDLALALVEEDMGKAFALRIAKQVVLFLKRPGNQVQYSNILSFQEISHLSIRKVCEWLLNNLSEELTVEKLAEQAVMSPRNFARIFVRELNTTPLKYIDRLRVETACQYLLETQESLDEIGTRCGVKNAENLRRLFLKVLDTTPTHYRKNFNSMF